MAVLVAFSGNCELMQVLVDELHCSAEDKSMVGHTTVRWQYLGMPYYIYRVPYLLFVEWRFSITDSCP